MTGVKSSQVGGWGCQLRMMIEESNDWGGCGVRKYVGWGEGCGWGRMRIGVEWEDCQMRGGDCEWRNCWRTKCWRKKFAEEGYAGEGSCYEKNAEEGGCCWRRRLLRREMLKKEIAEEKMLKEKVAGGGREVKMLRCWVKGGGMRRLSEEIERGSRVRTLNEEVEKVEWGSWRTSMEAGGLRWGCERVQTRLRGVVRRSKE